MPQIKRKCRNFEECENEYIPHPTQHPGNILDCPECAVEVKPMIYGMMLSGANKHASEMEITFTTDKDMSQRWAKQNRRSGGQGVLKGIVERKS